MQDSEEDKTASGDSAGIIDEHRRKRVNRIKNTIVMIAIICLILPTIICIILGIQVNRLQMQMKELVELHSQYGLVYDDNEDYVYAAEKPIDTLIAKDSSTEKGTKTVPSESEQTTSAHTTSVQSDPKQADDLQTEGGTKENNPATNTIEGAKENNPATNITEGIYTGKKVYLTFDDGPSMYTDEILDILAEYHSKATFFVIGKTDDTSKELYKRIIDEGHSLGMHSYSHKYDKIYNSVEDFDKDFTKLWELLYDTTGYKPTIYRFPGGSDNLVNDNGMDEFIKYLKDRSIVYFDWNVVSGDATGVEYTKEQLINNVLDGVKVKNTSIVLMHDSPTKETTVEALPGLLEKLIAGGAEILPLDSEVVPIQMIKADSIK